MKTLSVITLLCLSLVGFGQNNKDIAPLLKLNKTSNTQKVELKPLIFWEPIVEMDDKIYPSYVWATSVCNYLDTDEYNPLYFGDSEGQIGIRFRNYSNDYSKVKLRIEAPDMMRSTELEVKIFQNDDIVEIFPEIDYRFNVLNNNHQPKPVMLKYSLYVNDELIDTKVKKITLQSIYECPYAFRHRSGVLLNQDFMFAAYVNENHPKINDEILPAITNTGIVDEITGYINYSQGPRNGAIEVLRQVFGVWDVLRNRGIKYSNIAGGSSSNTVYHQHVRTVDQSLRSSHANCIDGTVLMASILYKMGIEPLIVLVPGHAYLGFYANPDGSAGGRDLYFLETTILGTDVDVKTLSDDTVDFGNNIVSSEILTNHRSSFVAFLKALEVGNANYTANMNSFNKTDIRYRIFEVDAYRKGGILPLNH